MGQKIILTTEQYEKAVNSILNEILNDIDENSLLTEGRVDEGVWEKVKYGLSKLGRYKVGGKIFGRGKIDQEAAAKIQVIIDKKGNELIKNLDATIKEKNPEFPNNEKSVDFLTTIMDISAVYDSIVAGTSKKPDEEGYLPVDAANGIINDLREYVKKFLDVDLTAAYSVVDEAEGNVLELTEDELKEIDEAFGLNETEEVIDEDLSADVRKNLKGKRGAGDDFSSTRMQTLKSNKLPLMLAGIGASLGAFSWLVNTEWFKSLFDTPYNYTDTQTTTQIIQTKSEVLNDIKPGEGVYKLLGRVTDHPLDGNSNPREMVDVLKQIGGGDAHKGVDLLCAKGGVMMKPDEAAKGLHDLVNNPNQYKTLNDMFHGAASGTGKLTPTDTTLYGTIAGRNLTTILIKMVPKIVTNVAIKTGVKTGAGYAVAKGLGGVLGPIGVGLLAAGALVKIMRMKGQKQSRAATLNDLYQSIRNIEGGAGIIEPEGETIDKGEAQDPKAIDDKNKETGGEAGGETGKAGGEAGQATGGAKGGKFNDELYNNLKNLFKFVVNNRKKLGTRAANNVGAGGAIKSQNTPQQPKKSPLSDISRFEENVNKTNDTLSEAFSVKGRYIKDKRLIQFLEKSLSVDKLKSFEEFVGRVERIRDLIKKVNPADDKVLGNFLKKLDANPIMATDFIKLFSVDSQNAQATNALKAFIDDIFVTLYSGKYKFDSIIDKMGSVGGGNVNKLEEEKGYSASEPNKAFIKDAQDRGRFKKNLMSFLSDAIGMFQYLHKLKTQAEKGGNKKAEPKKQDGEKPEEKKSEEPKVNADSGASSTPGGGAASKSASEVNEEVNRIKKIMFG